MKTKKDSTPSPSASPPYDVAKAARLADEAGELFDMSTRLREMGEAKLSEAESLLPLPLFPKH